MTKKILTEKIEIVNFYVDKLKEIYHNNNKKLTNKLSLIALSMTREELEENKFSIACNMLKKKFNFKTISEITGLSLNEIKNISNGQ